MFVCFLSNLVIYGSSIICVQESNPLQGELARMNGLLNAKEDMCTYCASKLDHHIGKLC